MSIKDTVRRANDLHMVPVRVDAWDLDAFVRRPPARLRDVLEDIFAKKGENGLGSNEAMVRVVALCLCDSDGVLAFDYEDDLDILRDKDSDALLVVFTKVLEVLGLEEARAAREGRVGNSEGAPAGGSDSA